MNDLTAAILRTVASSDPNDARAAQEQLREHAIGTRQWHIHHATLLIQTYGTATRALRAIQQSRENSANSDVVATNGAKGESAEGVGDAGVVSDDPRRHAYVCAGCSRGLHQCACFVLPEAAR